MNKKAKGGISGKQPPMTPTTEAIKSSGGTIDPRFLIAAQRSSCLSQNGVGSLLQIPAVAPAKPANLLVMAPADNRKRICCDGINKADISGIVAFYDAMVQNLQLRQSLPINLGLIVHKGFPAFEKTIGKDDFENLKQYFGIGMKANKNVLTNEQVQQLLARLRTIENACFYIHGYQACIDFMSECLYGEINKVTYVSDEQNKLALAKLAFMAAELLCGYWYLQQDFEIVNPNPNSKKAAQVSFKGRNTNRVERLPNDGKSQKSNANYYGPEELMVLVEKKLKPYGKKCIFTDMLMYEIHRLKNAGILPDVLRCCELQLKDDSDEMWDFLSINEANPFNTVGQIRDLKKRIHPRIGVYPMETFLFVPEVSEEYIENLWLLWRVLENVLESKEGIEKLRSEMKNFRCVDKKFQYQVYMIGRNEAVSGEIEARRIVYLANCVCGNDIEMNQAKGGKVHVGQMLQAVLLAQACKCEAAFDLYGQMEIGNEILAMDTDGVMRRENFAKEKSNPETLVKELGITDEHLRRWGAEIHNAEAGVANCVDVTAEADEAEQEIDAVMLAADMDLFDDTQVMEFVLKWARLKGYLVKSEVDEQQRQIIQSVIIDGNQEEIRSFANGECTEKAFMEAIGFEEKEDIVKGYFDRYQVAPDELTKYCILINKKFRKKNGKTPAVQCTVRLYNYLVDMRIECGPDYVIMKRDRSLLNFKFPNNK